MAENFPMDAATESPDFERRARLLMTYFDGDTNEPLPLEIEQELAAHPEFRRLFVDMASQRVALQRMFRSEDAAVAQSSTGEATPSAVVLGWLGRAASAFSRPVVWSILAASLLFAGYVVVISWNMLSRDRMTAGSNGQDVVATIRHSEEVEWSPNPSSLIPHPSSIAAGQPLSIQSGLIELQLERGTTLFIEGPADWQITGENSATLTQGKLVAKVPQQAIGFTLETPTAKIIDLGTEFGVEVIAGESEVRVIKGLVDVQGAGATGSGNSIQVKAGQSVQITESGPATPEASAFPDTFKRLIEAGNKKEATTTKPGSPFDRWLEASKKLRTDSDLVAYYDFESQGQQLLNVVADKLHGEIITKREKTPWTQGRWNGKHALAFGQDFASVSIPDDPALHPQGDFAFAVWFRVDRDPGNTTALILGKGNFPNRSYTLWQFPATGLLTSVGRSAGGHYAFGTNKPLQVGQWYFAVCTYDSSVMRLYLDGVEVAGAKQMDSGVTIDDQPLMLGLSREVGAVPFTGLIDEVAIFRRALCAAEVAEMYRAGKPEK